MREENGRLYKYFASILWNRDDWINVNICMGITIYALIDTYYKRVFFVTNSIRKRNIVSS